MPLPDAKPDRRIYELLKTTDLENLTFSDFQKVAQTIYAEQGAEDELRRIVLVNLARLSVQGEWSGLTSAGGTSDSVGALVNPTVMHADSRKINATMRYGGGTYVGTSAIEYYYGPVAYPFVSPHTGTIADISIEVTTAAAGRSANIGIYSTSDSTGLPDSLIASVNIDVSSTGVITQTSFTGTPAVERGKLYWIAHFSNTDAASSGSASFRENNPSFNAPSTIPIGAESSKYFESSLPNALVISGQTSLPATVTATDCKGINRDLLDVIIGW